MKKLLLLFLCAISYNTAWTSLSASSSAAADNARQSNSIEELLKNKKIISVYFEANNGGNIVTARTRDEGLRIENAPSKLTECIHIQYGKPNFRTPIDDHKKIDPILKGAIDAAEKTLRASEVIQMLGKSHWLVTMYGKIPVSAQLVKAVNIIPKYQAKKIISSSEPWRIEDEDIDDESATFIVAQTIDNI